jgi:hypothetical protein
LGRYVAIVVDKSNERGEWLRPVLLERVKHGFLEIIS